MKFQYKKIGIYIHIPFCESKCGYCDFNSYPGLLYLTEAYLAAINKELEGRIRDTNDYLVDSIYIGGGTPSLVEGKSIGNLLSLLRSRVRVSDDCEISIEANPGSVDRKKLKLFKDSGINRLSLGVQSFQNSSLKRLGRTHSERDIVNSINLARELEYDNLSLDLIFGLPEQSVGDWKKELETAFQCSPNHISAYQLTIEDGTEFGDLDTSGRLTLPPESTIVEMYKITPPMLRKAGYERYEISNYAKKSMFCRHNVNTWRNGEYMGLGAGACSFFNGERTRNIGKVLEYIERVNQGESVIIEKERLQGKRKLDEILMLGLRMAEGVDLKEAGDRVSIEAGAHYENLISRLEEEGLLRLDNARITLTEKGMLFSNEVFLRL